MRIRRHRRGPRGGFTLIEMLVVIGIVLLLATLAVTIGPSFNKKQKTSMGAGQLQGWLFEAKQRAFRDNRIRGLRFLPKTTTTGPGSYGPGSATVTVADGGGIHAGMKIVVGTETVTVLSTNPTNTDVSPATSFTALFALTHTSDEPVASTGLVTECEFLEQPDNFFGEPPNNYANMGTATTVTFTLPPGIIFTNSMSVSSANPNAIFVNTTSPDQDALFLHGGTEMHLITGVPSTNSLTLATPLLSNFTTPSDYWIQRAPRPLTSEPVLKLPQDIAVDFGIKGSVGANYPNRPVDVLFTPTGSVKYNGANSGKLIFWVRDTTQPTPFDGEPTLITVYTRTGAIGAYAVSAALSGGVWAPANGSYFYYTEDASSSGM